MEMRCTVERLVFLVESQIYPQNFMQTRFLSRRKSRKKTPKRLFFMHLTP